MQCTGLELFCLSRPIKEKIKVLNEKNTCLAENLDNIVDIMC